MIQMIQKTICRSPSRAVPEEPGNVCHLAGTQVQIKAEPVAEAELEVGVEASRVLFPGTPAARLLPGGAEYRFCGNFERCQRTFQVAIGKPQC